MRERANTVMVGANPQKNMEDENSVPSIEGWTNPFCDDTSVQE